MNITQTQAAILRRALGISQGELVRASLREYATCQTTARSTAEATELEAMRAAGLVVVAVRAGAPAAVARLYIVTQAGVDALRAMEAWQ
jgi:hypothetical protein